MTQAEVIGSNSTAALAFRDANTAREILAALRAKEGIVAAALYTPDGQLFTHYRRDGRDSRLRCLSNPEHAGYRFDRNHLTVFHEIGLQSEKLGIALHRVGHAAMERAGESLHWHRRRSHAGLSPLWRYSCPRVCSG